MWIEPFNSRLLVLPEIPPSKVGSIHVPGNVERPAEEGTIVRVAAGVDPAFRAGRGVLFMHYSGRSYLVDGVEHKIMGTNEILAFKWELEGAIEAHPNQVLIRRDELPIERGTGIILPDSARRPKSVMSTIMAVGRNLTGSFACGERLIISAGVGRKIKAPDGAHFYACSPTEIIARVHDGVESVEDLGESVEGRYKEEMMGAVFARDEGLPDEGQVR